MQSAAKSSRQTGFDLYVREALIAQSNYRLNLIEHLSMGFANVRDGMLLAHRNRQGDLVDAGIECGFCAFEIRYQGGDEEVRQGQGMGDYLSSVGHLGQ
ncbi:hypothetical protein D3C76_821320 [compost metagenome]